MKSFPGFLLLALACNVTAATHKPAWARYHFREVASLHDIPARVRATLGAARPGPDGIADKGQPFNATDVIKHPWHSRRFVTAGHDGHAWLVAVEQGGYGYRYVIYLVVDRTLRARWTVLQAVGSLKSLKDLLGALPHAQAVTGP